MDSLSSRSDRLSGLFDPWSPQGTLPLNGPLERTSVGPTTLSFVTGLLGLGAAFILFQLLLSPVVFFVQIAVSEGGMSMEAIESPNQLIGTYTRELLISNSVGQVLGLAVPAILVTRLHSTEIWGYLRLRQVDGRLLLLSVVGMLGLQPLTQWLAEVNRQIPLPKSWELFEQTQMELIRNVFQSDLGLTFSLTMLVLVPGFCEELLFRGYAQRQFERATGPAAGVLLSGGIFGLYHLRPSQVLPLVVLGLYMAYLAWRTGSLIPAILVHMLNNAVAVVGALYLEQHPEYTLKTLEHASMPWYAVVLGFVILVGVIYVIHSLAPRVQPEKQT